MVDKRACVTVTADDAASLIQNGWKRVEEAQM
jgi:hypothetical protein